MNKFEQPMDSAPYRNGRPGIARKLQSPSRGVPRSALRQAGFVIPNPWDVGSAQVPAAARIPGAGDDQRGLCVLAGAA